MHLTVVDGNADIASVRSCQRTLVHLLHNTLQDSWHKACVDSTTNNRVVVLKLTTPLEVVLLLTLDIYGNLLAVYLIFRWLSNALIVRLDNHMYLTKLTCTTRLLLVTIVGLSNLSNSLTIWNLRCEELHLNLALCRDAVTQDIEVVLTLTLNNSLLQLLRVLNKDSWILETSVEQQLTELLLVRLYLSLNSSTVARLWEYDRLQSDRCRWCSQSIVCLCALQLNGATDITCRKLGNLDTVLTSNGKQLREFLLVACTRVHQLHTLGQLTTNYAEVVDFANMSLHLRLEYEQCHRCSLVSSNL